MLISKNIYLKKIPQLRCDSFKSKNGIKISLTQQSHPHLNLKCGSFHYLVLQYSFSKLKLQLPDEKNLTIEFKYDKFVGFLEYIEYEKGDLILYQKRPEDPFGPLVPYVNNKKRPKRVKTITVVLRKTSFGFIILTAFLGKSVTPERILDNNKIFCLNIPKFKY